ncbi:hypothetical protein HH308_02845 [Gordonia sp. TBRC 11910]|uniref:Uncharacterized protein n=1 Tax=Gordonia asplenii TaxID=2725283 RepID=A0A848KQ46_9ACTN|nr:hypothetical protein [Gordonia asplenii]NMO00149.1 hypothetical protein [Gordonia asplenii]
MPIGRCAARSTARWVCGGSVLAGALIGQVDRVVVKTYPVLLGAGLPLFA